MNDTPTPAPTTPGGEAREILLDIAARLASIRPTHAFTDGRRMAMILTAVTNRRGYMTDAADELEAEVLQYAPPVDRAITRGEYALILRRSAGGDDE
ncbi:hypothetical protein KQY30_20020 [Streptomyces sp. GMY02]|uniref:hypothetical protein n=1 Tax=Streptomyces sp. GMY02 TaxID=1333528 RepID=UPI001C2BA4B6|nr:hypothetical protein [Streptomyces sp. GMY02]QXE36187.1 hypothetical protein KQY30_20020 [Streptomyces sp. GMY02]